MNATHPYQKKEAIRALAAEKWLLVIVAIITFFANNDVFVPDIMESRNIVTAREMVEDGCWMVPTMNGELRLEKPPLPTWTTAAMYGVAGENVALLRGVAGLMGLLLTFFFYRFSTRVLRQKGVMPTLIMLTCYNVVLMGRTASWDIYCHAFMMGAICWLAEALQYPGKQWGRFMGAGLMLGLSFMSKGPVSFYGLFLPFLAMYWFCYRPKMKGKGWPLAALLVIAFLVSVWWYAWIYAFHPEALERVVGKESSNWVSYNVRPWWYYWKFFLESGVWSLLLLTAMVYPLFRWGRQLPKAYIFALGWMFLSLVLLSCLPEKKSRYLLPLLIPASYLMGFLVDSWIEAARHKKLKGGARVLFEVNGGVVTLIAIAVPVVAYILFFSQGTMNIWLWSVTTLFSLLSAGYMATGLTRPKPARMVWGVALLFCSLEIFALPSAKWLINNKEMHSIRLTREMQEIADVPFYYNPADDLRIELVYAAGRKIRPLPVLPDSAIDAAKGKALMPFVFLSHTGAGRELPLGLLSAADTVDIGVFDDNRRPKDSGRYDDKFVYRLTLVKPKTE